MPPHVHRRIDRRRNRLGRNITSSDDNGNAHNNRNKFILHSSGDDTVPFNQLTLDDFGGRSDALGG